MGRVTLAAALLLVGALQLHRLDDSDTWWHLATGRLVWSTGTIPETDPFSYTAAGAPWLNRQWLFELPLYLSWRVAGPAGPSLYAGLWFIAAFALSARLLSRRLPPWAAAAIVIVASLAAVERFTVRPEAVTFAFLAASLLLTDGPVRATTAAGLVLLQVVWANSHALSILGLVPIGAALVGGLAARIGWLPSGWREACRRDVQELRWLGWAALGAIAAEAATPFGIHGAVYPLWLLSLIRGGHLQSFTIIEHRATTLAELSPVAGAALVVLALLGLVALAAGARRLRTDHVVTAAAFAVLATMARRNVALLGLGMAPLLSSGLGPLLRRVDAWLEARRLRAALSIGIALIALVLTGRVVSGTFYDDARLTRAFGLGIAGTFFSEPAVAFLQRTTPGGRVLNDDILGGHLIWHDRKVFFDGRLQVYPDAVYQDWQRVLDTPARFAEVATRWGISVVILHHPSPGRLELARHVASTPGWGITYLDGVAVVLVTGHPLPALPTGSREPIVAFDTPGLAGAVERLVTPLRRPNELATAYYQRARALLFLQGRLAAAGAREDLLASLALEPHNDDARAGLAMIAQLTEGAR